MLHMEKRLLSTHEFNLRWVDLDAYNHMNNAKYYDLMSECRASCFLNSAKNIGLIVTENSCKYKAQVRYPDILIVEHFIQNICATSFELTYIFTSKQSTNIVAEGYAKMVCLDLEKNRPVRIPEEMKQLFEAAQLL